MSGKGKIPLRQCMGCREMKSKKEMVRILRTVDGSVVLDLTGRMNGRGAYICISEDCLEKALKRHGLDRAFKQTVSAETVKSVTEFIMSHKQ